MKLRNILIALLMVIGTTLMAQEKYEQAVVSQASGTVVYISVEGKEFKTTKIKPFVDFDDFSPLFKELATLRDDGWEVWNSSVREHGITYFLRRKLK